MKMSGKPDVYFNENDKFPAQWLRNLFPQAHVDQRDIRDVKPADVAGFRRCHFFGGIGGWEYALQLAGWPSEWPVWTGSCPCQSLSCAGKRKGEKDERHLWPEFHRLISECRPATIFGEQTASGDGREWLDGISLDLEELGYAIGSADLCAASVTAPQARQRLWWMAIARCADVQRRGKCREASRANGENESEAQQRERLVLDIGDSGEAVGLGYSVCSEYEREQISKLEGIEVTDTDGDGRSRGVGNTESTGHSRSQHTGTFSKEADERSRLFGVGRSIKTGGMDGAAALRRTGSDGTNEQECGPGSPSAWCDFRIIACRDGKYRRVSTEPEAFPLANGIPRDMGRRFPKLRSVAASARNNRVGRLKGYGNAIVPQVAAVFIQCAMEIINESIS